MLWSFRSSPLHNQEKPMLNRFFVGSKCQRKYPYVSWSPWFCWLLAQILGQWCILLCRNHLQCRKWFSVMLVMPNSCSNGRLPCCWLLRIRRGEGSCWTRRNRIHKSLLSWWRSWLEREWLATCSLRVQRQVSTSYRTDARYATPQTMASSCFNGTAWF